MLRWLKFPNPSLCAVPRTYGNNSPWHWFNYYYFKFHWTQEVFSGQERLWQKREEFLLPAQGFLSFPSSQVLEDELFTQGCFQTFFSVDQSPPGCWMLIIPHLKSSWWKGYVGWEETSSSAWDHLSHSLSHWGKTFLKDVQIQIFFWEPSPRCSSVRTWKSVVSTTISGMGQWMAVITTKPLLPNAGHSSANLPYCDRSLTILCLR